MPLVGYEECLQSFCSGQHKTGSEEGNDPKEILNVQKDMLKVTRRQIILEVMTLITQNLSALSLANTPELNDTNLRKTCRDPLECPTMLVIKIGSDEAS